MDKTGREQEQYSRFLQKVMEMEDAGELSIPEAEDRFERAMGRIVPSPIPPSGDSDD